MPSDVLRGLPAFMSDTQPLIQCLRGLRIKGTSTVGGGVFGLRSLGGEGKPNAFGGDYFFGRTNAPRGNVSRFGSECQISMRDCLPVLPSLQGIQI